MWWFLVGRPSGRRKEEAIVGNSEIVGGGGKGEGNNGCLIIKLTKYNKNKRINKKYTTKKEQIQYKKNIFFTRAGTTMTEVNIQDDQKHYFYHLKLIITLLQYIVLYAFCKHYSCVINTLVIFIVQHCTKKY